MTPLESAMQKLAWGSRQKSWSTDLSGDECSALLEEIGRLQPGDEVTEAEVPA